MNKLEEALAACTSSASRPQADYPVELVQMMSKSLENAQLIGQLRQYKLVKRELDDAYDRWIDDLLNRSIADDEIFRARVTKWREGGFLHLTARDHPYTENLVQAQDRSAWMTKRQLDRRNTILQQDLEEVMQTKIQLGKQYYNMTEEMYGMHDHSSIFISRPRGSTPSRKIYIHSFI